MPETARGLWYPSPGNLPNVPEDMARLAGDVNEQLDDVFNPPHVHAYKTADTSGIPSGSWTAAVTFGGTLVNDLAAWDAGASSRVYCRRTGLWHVEWGVMFAAQSGGFRAAECRLNAGGDQTAGTRMKLDQGGEFHRALGGSFDRYMTEDDDYLQLFAYQNSGSTPVIQAGSMATFISMRWVSE